MMWNIKFIKLKFLLILILLLPSICFALEKQQVTLKKCIDGDTARFILNNEEIKVRFLAIDTPETKHPTKGTEPYGKEASEYTCNRLTNAHLIEIEYDENSNKLDKYGRELAWVFVDGNLLQNELVSNGLAEVKYLYGDYKYTDLLKASENEAKEKKLNIYSTKAYKEENNNDKKISDKNEKYIKKEIKKYLKKIFTNILEEIFE